MVSMNGVKSKVGLVLVIGVVGVGALMYMATSVVPQVLVTLTKAAPSNTVSFSQSYLLAAKLLAFADGKDVAKVNVFVLDATGKPISGKLVGLTGLDTVAPVGSAVSDSNGQVSFEMTSKKAGQYVLSATIDGVDLGKQITVTFREQ